MTDLLLQAGTGNGEALAAVLARFREMAAVLGVDMEGELRRVREENSHAGVGLRCQSGRIPVRATRCEIPALGICGRGGGNLPCARAAQRIWKKPTGACRAPSSPSKTPLYRVFTGQRGAEKYARFRAAGSDITGALAAGAMGARLYENWTDVDGLMSADPRLVQNTVCVPEVSYRQMRLLSAMGAQVLHPDSLSPVMRAGIPTVLKNSFHPERPGTRIAGGARAKIPCLTGRALGKRRGAAGGAFA